MKKDRLWLLLIILIAFSLRLTRLGQQSLWYDESVTWLLSQMQLPDLIRWTAADIQPPLYYLLIWTSDILISQSEWALRFPSALFNTLTVPLIFGLARRLFPRQGPTTSLLATLIFALSPLMVYYSQEARMYTMLTAEATLASYLLLRVLYAAPKPSPPATLPRGEGSRVSDGVRDSTSLLPSAYSLLPTLYALTAAAALYTHYFAAFLLIAHALFVAGLWWQRGRPTRLLGQALQMFGLTALLFAPWLPTLLSRLGDDPSYWPGALKLDEALRKVLISFTVGETVFEQTGLILALITLSLFGVSGLIAIGQMRRQAATQPLRVPRSPAPPLPSSPRTSALFLLLWLAVPILLILGLSYASPKFNPRYTLLAYPAFCLLLAAAIAHLQNTTHHAPHTPHYPSPFTSFALRVYVLRRLPCGFTFYVSLLFLLATATFSLANWFTQRDFQKDDFRATAQFVRERIAADETVLLSSGHLFPVWAYYFGWDNWTPLPWMQRLNVNQVTGLDIAAEIAPAVAGQGGVWLVTWQDEVIDPNGVVPFWLDRVGQRPVDAGDFWGVGLEHWRLDPDELPLLTESPIDQPARFNFANRVELVGSSQLGSGDLVLFWRPLDHLPDDLVLTLALTDDEGHTWHREPITGRPGAYFYPPSRWPAGQIVMTRYSLPWQIGTPPGLYVAEVGLGQPAPDSAAAFQSWDILDEQGRPQRQTALIDYINVSHLVQPAGEPLPIAADPQIDFMPIVAIRRSILPEASAEPGQRLLLALLWQAGQFNADDISVAFDLIDAEGQTFRVGSSLTPSRRYNLPRWQPGEVVLGQYWLDIPPAAAPGPAALQLHLVNSSGFVYDEVFPLETLEIKPSQRNFEPPARLDHPLDAVFGQQISLLGLDCAAGCRARPGETISLTLHWRAEATPDKSYTVFTHLLDAAETVRVNADHAPPKPSQGWLPGEIITDPVTFTLPPDLPPGDYAVEIGLYDAADPAFTRLPLSGGETRVLLPDLVEVD